MANKTFIYVGAEEWGLYRKEANDDHWEELTEGMPPRAQAWPIAIDPQDPEMIFTGTQRGVYRSTDAGDHWDRMDMTDGRIVRSLMYHVNDPQVMFAGTEGSEIYRSDDRGESWRPFSSINISGAVSMNFACRILGMAQERANPDAMYAGLEVGGVARSLDGGESWETVNRQFQGNMGLMDSHGVTVGSPDSAAVFFPNRTGIWRSRDRGDSWENLHIEAFSDIFYCQGITMAPDDPNTLYAAIGADYFTGAGRVLRSTDQGDTWRQFDRGIKLNSTTFAITVNQQHPEQVHFVTRNRQVFSTDDSGQTWTEHPLLPERAEKVVSIACVSL